MDGARLAASSPERLARSVVRDLLYGTFLFAVVAFAIFLYARAPADAITRFSWTFFTMNILGFITYHLYPAAPPWYLSTPMGAWSTSRRRRARGPTSRGSMRGWAYATSAACTAGRTTCSGASPRSTWRTHCSSPAIEGWRWLGRGGRVAAADRVRGLDVLCGRLPRPPLDRGRGAGPRVLRGELRRRLCRGRAPEPRAPFPFSRVARRPP